MGESNSASVSRKNTLPKKFIKIFGGVSNDDENKNSIPSSQPSRGNSVKLQKPSNKTPGSSTNVSRTSSIKSNQQQLSHHISESSFNANVILKNTSIQSNENTTKQHLNITQSSTSSTSLLSSLSGLSLSNQPPNSGYNNPSSINPRSTSGTAASSVASITSFNSTTSFNNGGESSSSTNVTLNSMNSHLPSGRFTLFEDGTHVHNLKAAVRQEKLRNMLKGIMGTEKIKAQAKSAVPEILLDTKNPMQGDPPTLFSGLIRIVKESDTEIPTISGATYDEKKVIYNSNHNQEYDDILASFNLNNDSLSFAEKYGRCQEVIGKGAFGTVRLCHKKDQKNLKSETLYAVKEFNKYSSESGEVYSKRLISEFCISSSLKHSNIITAYDLFQDAKGEYSEVLEYCSGGDLFTLIIAAGKLEIPEADCFFKQLIRGVVYMHDMGVCHRDLKPENLLLTFDGVLKITDFGNSECFKMAWENDIHLSSGICGSSPYIAPEVFTLKEFDPRPVDIWACGVIYMAMRSGRQLWGTAEKTDEFYRRYYKGRKDKDIFEPVKAIKRSICRNVIYATLDPSPQRRINGKQILNSEWGREIKCCHESHAL
ncbi:hypothetical protein Kpol_1050p13 [Vanderwaltozyma polyspora DSM 70294]|uniref:non-specific serine/threonine protein kinase n=1 Tax=Vanderwaltozyma polyspora (strain ATCC 22028 / DSM 70294 / BCRC 21397 / CBS 2163 / NBRC 10782 / NRRL Y-8283 / UCD 57-17) TaxID=436907 RepID=A7TER0_VANPO|nr:uncharacterized protein Kpol_1050p13 [Vanderwaltozyma polyspora DSM 70294]EDO19156.1 hypothetical protein Kpol_1050p13 [Vanderwaltozyma polyspora DSM 70294]